MAAAGEPATGRRYALLVGCTEYDNNHAFRLVGPGNDVELFRQLLVGKFAFSPADIVVLAEQRGGQLRPTHASIAREFADLASKVRDGDQVVILLGGHGSQQPEQNPPDPNYPKPDGRDQIFLPADVGVWRGGKEHQVANAIPDYELRKWTKAITATGASLWLIVDSCCSGATLRGGETVRKVAPAALGISDEAFAAAADRDKLRGGTGGGVAAEPRHDLDEQSPNFVALYAARPDEPTVEIPLPSDSDGAASSRAADLHAVRSSRTSDRRSYVRGTPDADRQSLRANRSIDLPQTARRGLGPRSANLRNCASRADRNSIWWPIRPAVGN